MATQAELERIGVRDFTERFRREVIPLNNRVSYFSALPLSDDDVKDYLEEPLAAVPPGIQGLLGKALVFLVPYLQRPSGSKAPCVAFEKLDDKARMWGAHLLVEGECAIVLAIREREVAEYHYSFYGVTAALAAERVDPEHLERFVAVLRDELRATAHGEVDEQSWRLKTQLIRKQSNARRDSKLLRAYAKQAFTDTLTLYLHGICCDIDVETGPRQLASRYLRKRLELLRELYPPPAGYAVFPEELST